MRRRWAACNAHTVAFTRSARTPGTRFIPDDSSRTRTVANWESSSGVSSCTTRPVATS